MPPAQQESSLRGQIMAVDDSAESLRLLEAMLRPRGYEVRSFDQGQAALDAAVQSPPDLILLDVEMPEMSGYQVCSRLKANARLAGIPVIFLSARTATEDKVKAFRAGGVDYVSKPFRFEEVQARVETHLKLRRARQAERDLLDRTLHGALGALWELVQLTSPMLALRSRSIRDIVLCITERMAISDRWQFDLAAMLCLVGCITLPDEVVEKSYGGETVSPDEERMFRAHPECGARLLSGIPRLETVAEMIRLQQTPDEGQGVTAQARLGAHMLYLALELDRLVYRGIPFHNALHQFRMAPERFNSQMLAALAAYTPAAVDFEIRRAPIRNLREGMILEEDVRGQDGGLLILKKGTVLTQTWIERLKNFAKVRGAKEMVSIRVPKPASPGAFPRRGDGE